MSTMRVAGLVLVAVLTSSALGCASDTQVAGDGAGSTTSTAKPATGGTATTTSNSPESSAPPQAATTSADSGPTPAEGAVLDTELVFARSGGIAGVDQRMVVRPDGATTVVDGNHTHETRVAPEDLRRLAEGLATLDWDALQEASSSGSSADDDFLFTLTQGEREVQITGNQLPRPVPDAVVTAQEVLRRLLDE